MKAWDDFTLEIGPPWYHIYVWVTMTWNICCSRCQHELGNQENVLTSSGRTHRAIKGSSYGGSVSSEKLTLAFFLQSCKTKSGVGMSWAIDYEDMYTILRQQLHTKAWGILNTVSIHSLSDKHWLQSWSSLIFWVRIFLVFWRLREKEQKLVHRRLKVGIDCISSSYVVGKWALIGNTYLLCGR